MLHISIITQLYSHAQQNPDFSFRHFCAWLTWSNLNILVSSEILRSWAIQNSPWKLNLGNWKLSNLSSKESSFLRSCSVLNGPSLDLSFAWLCSWKRNRHWIEIVCCLVLFCEEEWGNKILERLKKFLINNAMFSFRSSTAFKPFATWSVESSLTQTKTFDLQFSLEDQMIDLIIKPIQLQDI